VTVEVSSVAEATHFYTCRVRLNDRLAFVAWYDGSPDGFLRDHDGSLMASEALHGLEAAARPDGFTPVVGEPIDYDFDRIRAWCAAPEAAQVDCKSFLDAWNFFDDLAGLHGGADTPYTRLSRAEAGCYDKLFWGNNLPAVTPTGERFIPSWNPSELDGLARVMGAGLELVQAQLGRAVGYA
jgi:hypothetical protein